ncbi:MULTISPECIES: phosphotransferase enzyme family protein [Saccharibacillus]|uniref:phosphotransferase enzyme family protein n=1 Tax=Saccharibacillus TaxID=456492 RepID=UPI001F168C17|nr:phosphotransferase [Saccharibacillus sp. WB 17]
MFSFAEGREKPIHHVEDSYLFGESVAQMHTATGHFQSEHARDFLDLEFLMDRPLELIQLHMQHRPEDYHFICEKMSELKKQLAAKIEAGLDWGICHGDLHGNTNTAFTDDGVLTHYDFDISGYGWRAYDIAAVALFVVLRQLWLFGLCFNESELVGGADFDEGFIDSKMEYFRKVVF